VVEVYRSALCLNDAPVCTPELAIEDVESDHWSVVLPMEFVPDPLPDRFRVELLEVIEPVRLPRRSSTTSTATRRR
jgi:hypothetical protein